MATDEQAQNNGQDAGLLNKVLFFVLLEIAVVAKLSESILGAWLADVKQLDCGLDSCVNVLFSNLDWLNLPARFLLCVTPLLLWLTAQARQRKPAAAAKLWPAYFFVIVLALFIGKTVLYSLIQGQLGASVLSPETMSAIEKWAMMLFFIPSIFSVVLVWLAWFVVSRCCFIALPDNGDNGRTSRRAFFAFSLFAALMMLLLAGVNGYLGVFGESDYLMMVRELEKAAGISIFWSILFTPLIIGWPVWLVAEWCDPGDRGLRRVTPTVLFTLLLGVTYALIGLFVVILASGDLLNRPEDIVTVAWAWLAWIIVANGLATWQAHLMVYRKHKLAIGTNLIVLVLFYGFFAIVLAAKAGWVGAQPERVIINNDMSSAQIGTPYEGRCDGVVRAGDTLWYLGYDDYWSALSELKEASRITDLAVTVAKGDKDRYQSYSNSFTVLSRQADDGSLEPVAYVHGEACLIPVPDADRLLLLTDLIDQGEQLSAANTMQPPPLSRYNPTEDKSATAIFESLDGGQHWQQYQGDSFSHMNWADLQFTSADELWITYSPYSWSDDEPYLGVSEDGGKSITQIMLPQEVVTSLGKMSEILPKGATISEDSNQLLLHLTYASPGNVVLWVSHKVGYHAPDKQGESQWHQIGWTDRLELQRYGGQWGVGDVEHIEDLYIKYINHQADNTTYALLSRGDLGQTVLSQLNKSTMYWDDLEHQPNPFWPLGESEIRDMWASNNAVVVDVDAEIRSPQWLHSDPFDGIRISADAYYYSNDQGKHWHKLAIDSYPGMLGLDTEKDQLYFQNYQRFEGRSPVYAFDLTP